MKRDPELIKQILKYCELHAPGQRGFIYPPEIPGYDADAVEYHVHLCHDAGYVRVNSHEALEDFRRNPSP